MDLYGTAKLFKAWNRDSGYSLETMEWCSEDDNVMNFSKFAVVFKIFEHFCLFLSLTIITGQQSFLSLADGLHDKNPDSKIVWVHFLHCDMWKLFFWILRFQFFLYDLVTKKARKFEVVVSNLIMEKIPSSLSLSLSVCWLAFLIAPLSPSRFIRLSLSLSLTLLLMPDFIGCYVAWDHCLLPYSHAPSIKV